MNTWLWPDHGISKSESRRLREEHNALVNLNADLLEALRLMLAIYGDDDTAATDQARAAIAKAGG